MTFKMTLTKVVTSLPVVAQARSFSELARNVTNIADPLSASVEATKIVISVCLPPNIKYPLKCLILFAQLGICVSTGGMTSVTSVALGIGTAKQVLEEIAG